MVSLGVAHPPFGAIHHGYFPRNKPQLRIQIGDVGNKLRLSQAVVQEMLNN